jgi:hypothetical protein
MGRLDMPEVVGGTWWELPRKELLGLDAEQCYRR